MADSVPPPAQAALARALAHLRPPPVETLPEWIERVEVATVKTTGNGHDGNEWDDWEASRHATT